jgi:hypothetical protein
MTERVQRKRTKGWKMPPDTIYVGRPTRWGNPYQTAAMTRDQAVRFFRVRWDRLSKTTSGKADLQLLQGKNLACWCRLDQACHADVLLDLVGSPKP